MTTELKHELFERELLNPLRGLALTKEEELVAVMILNATAAQPIGIKRLQRGLQDAGHGVTEREVKDMVRTLRKKHELPILSRRQKGGGLWWCENEEQMRAYYEHARRQPLDELHTLSRIVKANYPRLAGQLSLEDAGSAGVPPATEREARTTADDNDPWTCTSCDSSWTYLLTMCPNCGESRWGNEK